MDDVPHPFRDLSHDIIAACIEVHRQMGPGLLESTYEECLAYELSTNGIRFQRRAPEA
jgi:GxxExxY protein